MNEPRRVERGTWSVKRGGATLDDIALMATINSVLANRFSHYFWTGFYRVCGDRLVIGPYIGTVGCLQIEFGRGVCGTAAARRETIIVPGKVLGSGVLEQSVKVAALNFSASATSKIRDAKGQCMTIEQLLTDNPKGSGVRILR